MSTARAAEESEPNHLAQAENGNTGTKRKADEFANAESNHNPKHGTKRPPKQQKTLEESIGKAAEVNGNGESKINNGAEDRHEPTKDLEGSSSQLDGAKASDRAQSTKMAQNNEKDDDFSADDKDQDALSQVKADVDEDGKLKKDVQDHEDAGTKQEAGDAVNDNEQRKKSQPSNILEKGIVYFFTRGRVGVQDPESVQDLARSYFVLRPLAPGAELTDGAVQDIGNNRLIALPKKVWPKSGKDRFMAFVEKAKVNMPTLKSEFFSGSQYSTQTVGTRQTPEVTPIGEGVYAMTTTGGGQGTTHLVYMLTIPKELGQVQSDVGLSEKGSFVLSLKNPESSGPSYAQLPEGPEYPKEFIEEFRGRSWMPVAPKHLNYANSQMLLIGEDFESSNNLEPASKDKGKDEKETPQEELEKLEDEDEHRVERLAGNDTIFDDLRISSKEYPQVMTTW